MPIEILADDVVSQIAAGEVVERPASVVKELVENAIDAGARDIRVETRGGGIEYIRVSDDGCGIAAAEAEVAFRRHSTSKLRSADDLSHIRTLGFRGEALASIAAVSRSTLSTRARSEDVGVMLRLEAGRLASTQDIGRPPGTSITVEDLFFNVPARRKFLRSERTERGHIDAFVTRYAMAYPGVRLTLLHDGKVVFQSPGNDRLRDVFIAVYGLEVGAAVLDIIPSVYVSGPVIEVAGLIGPPSLHRANRGFITLFVNGRWVQDARNSYAFIQAYHGLLPAGRYPLGVAMITLPPEEVDVNVHPAKAEVRFRNSDAVFRSTQRAVRNTLLESAPVPPLHRPVTWDSLSTSRRDEADEDIRADEYIRYRERLMGLQPHRSTWSEQPETASLRPGSTATADADEDIRRTSVATDSDQADEASEDGDLPPLRVVGQVGATYIIAEGPEGLYLIDQHAAHERVLFEHLLAAQARAAVISQSLLEPRTVDISPEAAAVIEPHLETLAGLGFQLEPFGGTTVLVRAVPAVLMTTPMRTSDPAQVLEDVAAALLSGDAPLAGNVEETIARQVCKQAAIKAGQSMAHDEMAALVRDLERCVNPRTCPHGRPTMIHLSVAHLAREFGR